MHPLERLRANIQSCFFGGGDTVDRLLVCLVARGHALLEDVPGVGKTTLSVALARSLDVSINRVQMTPDMLPSDILGVTVFNQQTGEAEFQRGPIFANIVLADEVNRTTPRTQSALLEAMNEAQVSIDGVTRELERPFFVLATQNPYEFEGTYFLPESQLDRFLMRLNLGYPKPEDEARVLMLDPRRSALPELTPAMTGAELVELQDRAEDVRVDTKIADYVVRLASATRESIDLHLGVSPRGSLALVRAAKAAAMIAGRDYVIPSDVADLVVPVFAHRCVTRSPSGADGVGSSTAVLERLKRQVAVPV